MSTDPRSAIIKNEIFQQYQLSDPETEAVATKLADAMDRLLRAEILVDFGNSIPVEKLDALPPEKRSAFNQNIQKLNRRIEEYKNSIDEYTALLETSIKPTT